LPRDVWRGLGEFYGATIPDRGPGSGTIAMDDAIERAADAKKGSPFLTTEQAAYYVGLARETLEKMRREGRGPRFRKHGRYVKYHIDDLDTWSEENSTGETPSQAGGAKPSGREPGY
jgi:excisionase family DNA binding protein